MKNLRQLFRLGLVVVLAALLGGCIIEPLHGWGHEREHERVYGGYGYRR